MLKEYLQSSKKYIENNLAQYLKSPCQEYDKLYESMNYSLLMGGKRIRPILIKMVLESLGKDVSAFMPSICAIELIHSYSLIHDDLPAMDDDDYRRGKLTNHKVYGEGMAILAGDGLLTYAFELISHDKSTTDKQKIDIIKTISKNAGFMVGGQAFDLASEGKKLSLAELEILHRGKTGALFNAAIEIGLILAEANAETYQAYMEYADNLGLLFQITDDILDVTGTLEELGKMPGSDLNNGKATYVSILGLEEAKRKAEKVANISKMALNKCTADTKLMQALIDYLLERSS